MLPSRRPTLIVTYPDTVHVAPRFSKPHNNSHQRHLSIVLTEACDDQVAEKYFCSRYTLKAKPLLLRSSTDWLSFPHELRIRTDVVGAVRRATIVLSPPSFLLCHGCLGHFSQGKDYFVL
jgi:hypothetical protein